MVEQLLRTKTFEGRDCLFIKRLILATFLFDKLVSMQAVGAGNVTYCSYGRIGLCLVPFDMVLNTSGETKMAWDYCNIGDDFRS